MHQPHTITNTSSDSGFSKHILNTGHAYRSISDTMKVVKNREKRKKLI
jgi:hypothetical protein